VVPRVRPGPLGPWPGALAARPQGGLDFLPMLLNLRPH
jgi:hypothetical protein